MNVPITSDLGGYQEFWTWMLRWIAIGVAILFTPIYILLTLILYKIK